MQTDIEKIVLRCVSDNLTIIYQESACSSNSVIHDTLFGLLFNKSPLQEPLEALAISRAFSFASITSRFFRTCSIVAKSHLSCLPSLPLGKLYSRPHFLPRGHSFSCCCPSFIFRINSFICRGSSFISCRLSLSELIPRVGAREWRDRGSVVQGLGSGSRIWCWCWWNWIFPDSYSAVQP